MVVAFEVDEGGALLAQLAQTPVDVVLSDIRMPGMDGIAMLRRLRERGDATPVLLLTTFDDDDLPLRAAEAGAQGFLLKDAAPEDLHEAIVRVRSEEHTSELQSLMRISYAVFCLKKKKTTKKQQNITIHNKKDTKSTHKRR